MAGTVWVITGGADKGGIIVREGLDTTSPIVQERLSTFALVAQLELETTPQGDRLRYQRLTGTGPDTGWVSTKVPGKDLVVPAELIWEVVGGGDKGGIVVRQGKDTSSALLGERLSTGAHIKQVGLEGERLQYELIKGTGPATGWVSLRLPDKDLVLKAFRDLPQPEAQPPPPTVVIGPPLEIQMSNEEKGFSYEGYPSWVPIQAAREKLRREGKAFMPPPLEEPARIAWMKPLWQIDVEHPFQRTPDKKLREKTLKNLPGVYFNMVFPHNWEQIASDEFGAEWLTKAFHAAGTLPKDNKVTKLLRCEMLPTSGMDCAGGAGKKAFLTVEYEKPDPELHTEIFAKYPYEYDFFPEQRYFLSGQFDNDGLEVRSNLFLVHLLPFRTPKVYFADISRESTNWLLLTETIPFAKRAPIVNNKLSESPPLKPFETYPMCGKYQDYLLHDPVEFYCCIFRHMGQLAGWDKVGRYDSFLGPAVAYDDKAFLANSKRDPQNLKLKEVTEQTVAKMMDKGIEFVQEVAPQLFPKEVRAYMQNMKKEMVDMCPYFLDARGFYQGNHTDYIAGMHVNLQADNAYFWTDEYGAFSCGVLDWGNFGRSPFCGNFLGCISGLEPERMLENLDKFMQCFVDEYARCGGPRLPVSELVLRFHLIFIVGIYDSIQWLERTVYKKTPKEKFKEFESIKDENFQDTWETRCRVCGWIYSLIYYVQKGDLKEMYDGWVKGPGAPYLTVYQ